MFQMFQMFQMFHHFVTLILKYTYRLHNNIASQRRQPTQLYRCVNDFFNKFAAFTVNLSHFASNREEALSIMKWLYLFSLCVALVASENPDGKFFFFFFFFWVKQSFIKVHRKFTK